MSAFVSALGRFGLSLEDVSDGVLEAVMETERRGRGRRGTRRAVSAPRLVILLGALCQGSFETKIEVCFRSMDAKGVKGITSDQATEFASACVHVFGALLEGDGGERLDFSWATAMWARCMRDSLDEKNTEDNLGMFTLDEFKALVERMFESAQVEHGQRRLASHTRQTSIDRLGRISSVSQKHGFDRFASSLLGLVTDAEYVRSTHSAGWFGILDSATGGGGGGASASPSSHPGNIISKSSKTWQRYNDRPA